MCDALTTDSVAPLKESINLNTIISSDKVFGALKLIEHLVQLGEVPEHVFKNILLEQGDAINLADFKCYKDG